MAKISSVLTLIKISVSGNMTTIVTGILIVLGLILLFLSILTLLVLRRISTNTSSIHVNLCMSSLLTYLLMVAGSMRTDKELLCTVVAIVCSQQANMQSLVLKIVSKCP